MYLFSNYSPEDLTFFEVCLPSYWCHQFSFIWL